MAQQTINVGAAPNDGTGDPARTAFTKSNDNFTELYSAVAGANQIFYCDLTDAADVATYKRLLLTPSTHGQSSASAVCTGTTTDFLIASFITDPGVPGAIEFPAGSAYRRLYGSVSGGAARFRMQVYTRTAGGVETLARDETSNNFSDTVATLQEWLATPSAGTLSATDRLVVKISARRISGPTNVTVTLYSEGSAHASQVQTTISLGSSASISATPPLMLSGGNLTIDLRTMPQGRLTLQTATPVMTSTQSAKTTIYYTPYVGNQAPIYDGTNMAMSTFAELSNVTTASSTGSAGPAAVAANSCYDLFVWSNAGTLTLTRGPAWTSDTARSAGTALVMVNGIWLNNAAITNGPAASRGTYVGTVRSNASSQLDWMLSGSAATGSPLLLGVWNMYNRVTVQAVTRDTADHGIIATAFTTAGSPNTNITFVSGLAEDAFDAVYQTSCFGHSTTWALTAVGLDGVALGSIPYAAIGIDVALVAQHGDTVLGAHVVAAMEAAGSSGGANFMGSGGTLANAGLRLRFRM